MQSFLEDHAGGLGAGINKADQVGLYFKVKDFDMEGSKKCLLRHVAYEDGNLLSEAGVILAGWK